MKKKKKPNYGRASLIIGIISLFICWIPLVGQVMSAMAIMFAIFSKDKKTKKISKDGRAGMVMGVIGLVAGIAYIVFLINGGAEQNLCKTELCLKNRANDCAYATLLKEDDFGTVKYTVSNCTMWKRLVEVKGEPEVQEFFTNATAVCYYPRGEFNDEWVDSLVFGLDDCEGDLREKIGELMLFI